MSLKIIKLRQSSSAFWQISSQQSISPIETRLLGILVGKGAGTAAAKEDQVLDSGAELPKPAPALRSKRILRSSAETVSQIKTTNTKKGTTRVDKPLGTKAAQVLEAPPALSGAAPQYILHPAKRPLRKASSSPCDNESSRKKRRN